MKYGIVRGSRPGRGTLIARGLPSRSTAIEKAKKMSRLSESYFTVVDEEGGDHAFFLHGKELHPHTSNDSTRSRRRAVNGKRVGGADGVPSKPRTWYEVRAKDKVLVKTKDKKKALRYGREKAKSLKRATVVVFVTWTSARKNKAEFVESFAPNGSVSTVSRVGGDKRRVKRDMGWF